MSRSYLYLFLALLSGLLGGCYKDAPNEEITGGTTVTNDDEDENDIAQNRWTYEQMRSDYLWEAYLPDSSTLSFNDIPKRFFNKLLYEGDRFSWIELNESFSGYSLYDSFGIDYLAYETTAGDILYRTVIVRKGSPAEKAGLRRGDWFRTPKPAGAGVIEIETGQVTGNLFLPAETLKLLQDDQPEAGGAVELDTTYHIGNHIVGYIVYNEFVDAVSLLNNPYRAELRAAFDRFREQQVTDLIIDLRYNRGGHVTICQFFSSLLLKDEHLGSISGYHSFNQRLAAKQLRETGNEEEILYFAGANVVGESNVGLDRLTFIIGSQTASASESLINNLSPFAQVTKIGSTSTGKGVGSWTIQSLKYEWQIQPITFRYYNSIHETVPDSGLEPDIHVDEQTVGTLYERGDVRELLLHTALAQISGSELRSAADYGVVRLRPHNEPYPSSRKIQGYIDNLRKDSY
jgi:C-terminal processing protease CtpA/Prc